MKSKVTLKEMVGTKIVYAVLLVCYYWMWARRDWHDYYETIQSTVVIFTVVFFVLQAIRIYKYSKEEKDELAVQNLRRKFAQNRCNRFKNYGSCCYYHCLCMRCLVHRRKNGRLCACQHGIGINRDPIYNILRDGQ